MLFEQAAVEFDLGGVAHGLALHVGELHALAGLLFVVHAASRELHHDIAWRVTRVVGDVGADTERAAYAPLARLLYLGGAGEVERVAEDDGLGHGVDAEFAVAGHGHVDETQRVARILTHAVEERGVLLREVLEEDLRAEAVRKGYAEVTVIYVDPVLHGQIVCLTRASVDGGDEHGQLVGVGAYHLHPELHGQIAVRCAGAVAGLAAYVLHDGAVHLEREAATRAEVREEEVLGIREGDLLLQARHHSAHVGRVGAVAQRRDRCEHGDLVEGHLVHEVRGFDVEVSVLCGMKRQLATM